MKKLLVLFMGVAFASMVWADANTEIQKTLEDLQARLQQQENKIADLQRRINESGVSREEVSAIVKQELDRTVDAAGWAQSKDLSPSVVLANHIRDLTISGELRLRWENAEYQDDSSEYSWQGMSTRLRLGGVWKTSEEGWEIGVGVVTGDYNDAYYAEHNWGASSPFNKGELWLDYAYAKHSWVNEGSEMSLTLGRIPNPFITSDVFWDEDIRVDGVVGQARMGDLFITLAGLEVYNNGTDSTDGTAESSDQAVAVQLGFDGDLNDSLSAILAAGYYHYNNSTSEWVALTDYDFQIGDLYASVNMAATDDVSVGAYGHVWKNFGADGAAGTGQLSSLTTEKPEDMDMGYVAGVSVGVSIFTVGAEYIRVESDSVPFFQVSNDFFLDLKGYRLFAKANLTENFSIGVKYTNAETIDIDSSFEYDFELWQVDAVYAF
jgi:hypothetical protein